VVSKYFLPCVFSAFLGAVLAAVLADRPIAEPPVSAQEQDAATVAAGQPGLGLGLPGELLPEPLSPEDLTPEERVNIAVYEAVNRSVVNIATRSVSARLYSLGAIAEGEGSGTVIDRQGHVLTNFHVIDGAREIQVTLYDGKTYEGQLVGVDPASDIAVLKIDAPAASLVPVVFGNSTHLLVGQRVYAIGNPFGLERTLSTGIISSLNRTIPSRRGQRTIKSIIQIDAAINPGNSGGPLLDSKSRMIGMNTAIASKTGESAGVGFAIPVSTIGRIVPELIRSGRIVRPEIGIAQVYKVDRGLLIASLIPGGPAEQAGLKGPQIVRQRRRQGPFVYEYTTRDRTAADLIVAVDGQPVKTGDGFLTIVESKKPGEEVTLTIVRDGKRLDVPVRLAASE